MVGAPPFGSSSVQNSDGCNTSGSVTGCDICKLFNTPGRALGYGATSFGDGNHYYNKRFDSSGDPGSCGEKT